MDEYLTPSVYSQDYPRVKKNVAFCINTFMITFQHITEHDKVWSQLVYVITYKSDNANKQFSSYQIKYSLLNCVKSIQDVHESCGEFLVELSLNGLH